jgi:hypothetical protein
MKSRQSGQLTILDIIDLCTTLLDGCFGRLHPNRSGCRLRRVSGLTVSSSFTAAPWTLYDLPYVSPGPSNDKKCTISHLTKNGLAHSHSASASDWTIVSH